MTGKAESYLVDMMSWCLSDNSTVCTSPLDNIFQITSPLSDSLIGLCCTEVIQHGKRLNIKNIYFSSNLYPLLMMEAFSQNLSDTAFFLMSTWPIKTLSVIDVVPYPEYLCGSLFETITRGYGPALREVSCRYLTDGITEAMKGILSVIRLFLDVIQKDLTPNLRVLDLCGWVLNDKMMKLLIRGIIKLLDNKWLSYEYHIFIECAISWSSTYKELMALLRRICKSKEDKIVLHFKKLDLCGLTKHKTWQLLLHINPTELMGLTTSYFSSDFMEMVLRKVPSLTTLNIDDYGIVSQKRMMPLHLLPRLRRLVLSTRKIGLCNSIPKCTLRQLEYLAISIHSDDSILENDFLYMISMPLQLRELNLSYHEVITAQLDLWRKLFLSLASTLKVLMLEECFRDETNFGSIVRFILPLVRLVFLDLAINKIGMKALREYLPMLGSMPQLKRIAVSYPDDRREDDCVERANRELYNQIEDELATKKLIPTKIDWFHWFYWF